MHAHIYICVYDSYLYTCIHQLVIEREQELSEASEKTSHVLTVLANLAKPEIFSGIVRFYCVASSAGEPGQTRNPLNPKP
jgi:transcription antitermination factor NusA-like protein